MLLFFEDVYIFVIMVKEGNIIGHWNKDKGIVEKLFAVLSVIDEKIYGVYLETDSYGFWEGDFKMLYKEIK